MAVTWDPKIVVTNRAEARVRITGIRTDGEDVQTFSADGQVDRENVQASLRKILDSVFAQYTEGAAAAADNAELIEGWEADAATYLNGKET